MLIEVRTTHWDLDRTFFDGSRTQNILYESAQAPQPSTKVLPSSFFVVALDVTANCICEIHCLALDGFDLNIVHKLSSGEKKPQWSWN